MGHGIDFELERRRLTRWAWGVTAAYVVVLVLLASFAILGEKGLGSFLEMSPNEVGDLLAGIAGPLAFIWLVYGYFLQGIAIRQQAEELRQNTDALRMQAEELKMLVAAENAQMELMRDSQSPFFLVYPSSWNGGQLTLQVKNVGAPVSNLVVTGSSGFGYFQDRSYHAIDRNQTVSFQIDDVVPLRIASSLGRSDEYWISVGFQSANGLEGLHFFDYDDDPPTAFGKFVNRKKPLVSRE